MSLDGAKINLEITGENEDAKRAMREVGVQAQLMSANLKASIDLSAGFQAFNALINASSMAFGAAKDAVVGYNSSLDQSRSLLEKYFATQQDLNQALAWVQQFAADTPFEFPDLVKGLQNVVQISKGAADLKDNLNSVAVAIANTGNVGSEQFQGINLVLGQIISKGKLAGEEVQQLNERNLQIVPILANYFQTSTNAVTEMISDGAVSSKDLFAALREYAADPANQKAMEAMSKSFEGSLSTIKDNLTAVVADGFRPLYDGLVTATNLAAQFVSSTDFKSWGEAVKLSVGGAAESTKAFLQTLAPLGEAIQKAFSAASQGDFSTAFTELSSGVGDILDSIGAQFHAFGESMLGAGANVVETFAAGMIQSAQSTIFAAVDYIASIVASFLIGNSPPEEGPLSQIDKGGENTGRAWGEGLTKGVGDAAKNAAGAASEALDSMKANVRDVTAQMREVDSASKEIARSMKAVRDQVEEVKESFKNQTDAVKAQASQVKEAYADQISNIRDNIDTIKDSYANQTAAVTAQIDAIKDEYSDMLEDVRERIDTIKEAYDNQTAAVQAQIESVKDRYTSAIDSVKDKIDATKASYDAQQESIDKQIASVKDRYTSAVEGVKSRIDSLRESYAAQQDAIDQQIDAVKNQYTSAIDAVRQQMDTLKESYSAQQEALATQIDTIKTQYTAALDDVKTRIVSTKEAYDDQLSSIQRQISAARETTSLLREQEDIQKALASAATRKLQLEALGDPVLRAQLGGQLAQLGHQEDLLDITNDIMKEQAKLANPELDEFNKKLITNKLAQLNIQKQLAEMVNVQKLGEATQQSQLQKAQKEQLSITREIEDANRRLVEIPLEAQMKAVKTQADEALKILNAELKLVQTNSQAAMDPLILQMKNLKQEEANALKPLQDRLKELTADQKAALEPLQAKLKAIKDEEKEALKPLQNQLKSLAVEQKAALDPLQAKLKSIKDEEKDALSGLQTKLKNLQKEQKDALDPLQDKLKALKVEEAQVLKPLQQTLKELQKGQQDALEPLQQRIKDIKAEEANALKPLEDQIKSLQKEAKAAAKEFDAQLASIQQQQKETLKPLEDQLAIYEKQKDALALQKEQLAEIKAQLQEQIRAKKEAKDGDGAPDDPFKPISFPIDKAAEEARAKAVEGGKKIAEALQTGIGDWFKSHVDGLTGAIFGGVVGGAAFGPIGAAIGALVGAAIGERVTEKLKEMGYDWESILTRMQPTINLIRDSFVTILQAFQGDWAPSDEIDPFVNSMGILAESIKMTVVPAVQGLWTTLQSIGTWMSENREIIAGVATAFLAFAGLSALAPIITTIVAAFSTLSAAIAAAGGLTALLSGLAASIAAVVTTAGGFTGALSAVVALLGGPVTLTIAAVAGAIGLFTAAWIGNWGDIQGKATAAWEALQPAFDAISSALTNAAEIILPLLATAWQTVVDEFSGSTGLWDQLSEVLGGMFSSLRELATELGPTLSLIGTILTTVVIVAVKEFTTTLAIIISIFKEVLPAAIQASIGVFQVMGAQFKIAIDLITGLVSVATKLLQGDFKGAWEAAGATVIKLKDDVQLMLDGINNILEGGLGIIIGVITGAFTGLAASFPAIVETIRSTIADAWEAVKTTTIQSWDAVKQAVVDSWNAIQQAVDDQIAAVKSAIMGLWNAIPEDIRDDLALIKNRIVELWTGVVTGVTTKLDEIKTGINNTWTTIADGISTRWAIISTNVGNAVDTVKANISAKIAPYVTIVSDIWTTIGSGVRSGWDTINTVLAEKVANVTGTVDVWKTGFVGIFSNILLVVGEKATEIGNSIMDGISTAVTAKKQALIDQFWNVIRDILAKIKTGLGIASPSTVFKEIGEDMMEGMMLGVKAIWDSTVKTFFEAFKNGIFVMIGWATNTLTWIEDLKSIGKTIISGMLQGVQVMWEGDPASMQAWFQTFSTLVIGAITGIPGVGTALAWANDLIAIGKGIITGLLSGAKAMWSGDSASASVWFQSVGQLVLDAISNTTLGQAVTWLVNIGKDILGGLKNGLIAMWGQEGDQNTLAGWFKWMISQIPDIFKKLLDLHSPSMVMHGIGTNIMQGIINGLKSKFPDAQSLISKITAMFGSIGGGFNGSGPGMALIQMVQDVATSIGGADFGRAAAAISASETGGGASMDQGPGLAKGPFQFDPGGELIHFAKMLGVSMQDAGMLAIQQPMLAIRYALEGQGQGLSGPGYLGRAIKEGLAANKSGRDLALYGSQFGQRPFGTNYLAAGEWYDRLFGALPGLATGGIVTKQMMAMLGEGNKPEAVIPLDRLSEFTGGRGGGATFIFQMNGDVYDMQDMENKFVKVMQHAHRSNKLGFLR